jgi:hypothetical protein
MFAISVNAQGDEVSFDTVWHHIMVHGEDIAWAVGLAAFFGILFAVVFDLFSRDSRVRAAIRHVNNRMSEQSILLMIQRIEQLERYKKQLADARWIYLIALQGLFLTLIVFSSGVACLAFSLMQQARINPQTTEMLLLISACFCGGAAGFALVGLGYVLRDTPEKVQSAVRQVDLEIEGLQKVLRARSPRDTA